jgi:uncharacterized membrane protein YheB (UPF0754 family)
MFGALRRLPGASRDLKDTFQRTFGEAVLEKLSRELLEKLSKNWLETLSKELLENLSRNLFEKLSRKLLENLRGELLEKLSRRLLAMPLHRVGTFHPITMLKKPLENWNF